MNDANPVAGNTSDFGNEDDDGRLGGPITSGMIHTAWMRESPSERADDLVGYRQWVHQSIDMDRLAQHINSWLKPVV